MAVWSPNTHHWVLAALGALGAGGTLVPVSTRFTGHEALDVISRSGARVLFVAGCFLGTDRLAELRAAARETPSMPERQLRCHHWTGWNSPCGCQWNSVARGDGLPDPPIDATASECRPSRPCGLRRSTGPGSCSGLPRFRRRRRKHGRLPCSRIEISDILFTSGTTGQSKGAMSSHRQALGVAAAWADCGGLTSADRYLVINPFFHSFGYKAGILVCLLTGAVIVPQPVFDAGEAMRLIEAERITVLPGAPTLYQTILDHPDRDHRDLSSLRLAVTGAAIVPVALVERMRQELSFGTVLTAYGLTEAVVATMCRPGDDPETVARTSGRAAAGFEVRVAGPDGQAGPGRASRARSCSAGRT